jgi:hypothetical protein
MLQPPYPSVEWERVRQCKKSDRAAPLSTESAEVKEKKGVEERFHFPTKRTGCKNPIGRSQEGPAGSGEIGEVLRLATLALNDYPRRIVSWKGQYQIL